MRGDKTVNKYHLYRNIKRKIDVKEKAYFDKPLKWYSASLDRWHKKFRYGKSYEDLSNYDILEIVSILMREDMFVLEGKDAKTFKKKLYENHSHYLERIDTLGFRELCALSHSL